MLQYIADAFTDTLFAGNPAAVLPCRTIPDSALMQALAIENNYSETAFVVRRGNGHYNLKWFTPGGEVELCGHATLATSFILHLYADKGVEEMHFHTLSGELIVRPGKDGYTMDFPVGPYKPIPVTEAILAATGGLAREAYYDGGDMIAVVDSEEALAALVPDYDAMGKVDGRGLIITAKSKDYDFVSRCFYPKLNVPKTPSPAAPTPTSPPSGPPNSERPKCSPANAPPAAATSASAWKVNASSSPAKRCCS